MSLFSLLFILLHGAPAQAEDSNAASTSDEVLLSFSTTPPGASVHLDGDLICEETPCSTLTSRGKHKVRMSLENYKDQKTEVRGKQDTMIHRKLKPDHAKLSITSIPLGQDVYLDGEFLGHTPIREYQVKPGKYELKLKGECHKTRVKKIRLKMGDQKAIPFKMRPRKTRLKVYAKHGKLPLTAKVFIDGEFMGMTPFRKKVPLCSKEVKVLSPDYRSWQEPLNLTEKKNADVKAKFSLKAPM